MPFFNLEAVNYKKLYLNHIHIYQPKRSFSNDAGLRFIRKIQGGKKHDKVICCSGTTKNS